VLAPAIPMDEKKRLATLRGLNILDTPPEERFDRLTRLAQRIFDVPIAVITLIDSNRQWFKLKRRAVFHSVDMPSSATKYSLFPMQRWILVLPTTPW
jgi:hypothetical protein